VRSNGLRDVAGQRMGDLIMISPDARILPFRGTRPVLSEGVFVAPGAMIIGDVIVAEESSLWYHAIVRGDMNFIRIGRRTNIQDLAVIHVTTDIHSARIGDGVTVGHSAVVHGAVLEDGCLIGMGAIILDGARVGQESMIGAGSVVPLGMEIPPRVLAVGSPARVKRPLRPDELEEMRSASLHYLEYARLHARELGLIPPAS
jgi:gamma-carbonic anhydrase